MDTSDLNTGHPSKIGGFATRIGLLVTTNIAVIALFTFVASIFGLDPQSIIGLTIFAALFGFGGSFVSLALSKKIAKRSTGAAVIENPRSQTEQWLLDTVARLARDAGIDTPEVAIYDSPIPNAFATGAKRNDALVAVSIGLLRQMKVEEVEAVLAHEIAHVANGDMVTLSLIQGVLNTFVILISRIIANVVVSDRGGRGTYFIVVIVLQMILGFFASMIVAWFSRRREFRADAGSGQLTSNPQMVSALQALQRQHTEDTLPDEVAAFGIRSSTATGVRKLFSSHPPLEERIAALQR
ncbi:MAG: protease HtpX [Ilumatobacter sp.]|nr:protease HtpX [Ilumatobacter sp.]